MWQAQYDKPSIQNLASPQANFGHSVLFLGATKSAISKLLC